MPTIFDKLNLKSPSEIIILNAPASFEPELDALAAGGRVMVRRDLPETAVVDFLLAFVTRLDEVEQIAQAAAARARGDALLWFAYPKATSKKYKCEFNRDNGWAALGQVGFQPVRQVAIDEDWSALRFRRSEFVKR